MFLGIPAEKDQLDCTQITSVGFEKTQHIAVKAGHALQVAHVKAHVTEHERVALGERAVHGFSW
jgi:hypothetical protein